MADLPLLLQLVLVASIFLNEHFCVHHLVLLSHSRDVWESPLAPRTLLALMAQLGCRQGNKVCGYIDYIRFRRLIALIKVGVKGDLRVVSLHYIYSGSF